MRRATRQVLAELHFSSHVRDDLPPAALCRLAREASQRNMALGVTGEMRFEAGRFHQIVEGPSDTILMLASAILADHRHERIEVQGFRAIEARRYPDWRVHGIDASGAFCALRVDARTAVAPPPGEGWIPLRDGALDRRA